MNLLSTKQRGDLAEAEAIRYFVVSGYKVCLPIGNKASYDFIIDKNGNLSKVQVKYAGIYRNKGSGDSCRAALRITGGNQSFTTAKKYSDDAFDILYVYTAKGEQYVLPWKDVTARNEIYIEHPKYQRYNVSDK